MAPIPPAPMSTHTKTFSATDSYLSVLMYNFDIGSAVLKPEHLHYIETTVYPYLSKKLPATIVGLASRTGPDAFNMTLSKARADNVVQAIQAHDPSFPSPAIQFGEELARLLGVPDNAEDDWWRSVLIILGEPPKPKKPTGRFYDRLWIYDETESILRYMVAANDRPDTYLMPITKKHKTALITLREWLDILVKDGVTFGAAVFNSHGRPGTIGLDGSKITAFEWKTFFAGRGYETLFPSANSKVYFVGCDVADGNDGWEFLEQAGRVFLGGAGGECYGWTSLGFAMPSYLWGVGGHAVHLWGNIRYVEIARGGGTIGRREVAKL